MTDNAPLTKSDLLEALAAERKAFKAELAEVRSIVATKDDLLTLRQAAKIGFSDLESKMEWNMHDTLKTLKEDLFERMNESDDKMKPTLKDYLSLAN